jgi:ABC-type glycerol-3-phosphate transport system permease component
MYYVLNLSLSAPLESVKMKAYFYPKGFYFKSYKLLFHDAKLWHAYRNTIMYVVANTVLMLATIMGVWNSWFSASVYLPKVDWQPLQLYLRRVLVELDVNVKDFGAEAAREAAEHKLSSLQIRYAMIIFTTLPVIFTYPFFQKYFVKGIMIGSLKE